MMPLALVTAIAMLAMWFPVRTFLHQQSQLDAAANQISLIQRQEKVLSLQAHSISSKAAATLLARQQYQLVEQGQSLIQVLPGTVAGHPNQWSGDPGDQPLVSPSSVSSLVHSAPGTTHSHSHAGFLARLVRTLEFWR
ncbi:MAG TPA: hypothetical protein VLS91_03735 [Acidimicrobiales bacterium]|nr:hypothetical protein [Acidimicrobiales bacterium]